ncbi:DUF1302 family protein [Chitinolyticbacter albus]|uniref:DUF1302 family protein n=1 Tax=Chitinolyticbacter albus TaxID=2961951 RepID=UPI002108E1AE|nr:DUF1302 family protein [Chitinolyticbacter albus]
MRQKYGRAGAAGLAQGMCCALILLVPGSGWAIEAPQISGELGVDWIQYLHDAPAGTIDGHQELNAELEAKGSLPGFNYLLSADGRVDALDADRNRARIKEAYADIDLGSSFNFRLGKQLVVWGRADVFNPTDNINPIDLSDQLDTERIPVIMAIANYYWGDNRLQAVVVPRFTANILPDRHSRWRPSLPAQVEYQGQIHPIYYQITGSDRPDDDQIATVALKFETSRSGWDWSLSYLYGYSSAPAIRETHMTLDPQSGGVVLGVEQLYYRQSVIGFDFSTTAGAFGLRGEAALFLPEHGIKDAIGLDRNYAQFAFGVDRTHSNVVGENDLYWIVEAFGNSARPHGRVVPGYMVFPYSYGVAGKLEYRVGYEHTLGLEALIDVEHGGYLLRPKYTYDINDALRLEMWAELLGGRRESFPGAYSDNDRLQLKLTYSF